MGTVKTIDGLPVIDAKRSVKVHITKTDIAKADTKHPESCAAARAICRDLNAHEAKVHLGRIYVRANKGNWVRYATPQSLRSEIIAFDRGGSFAPGDYELHKIAPSQSLGKRRGSNIKRKRARNDPKRKKRAGPKFVADVRHGPA